MSYMPPPDPKDDLAKRLAVKAGLPEEQAGMFLGALVSLVAEEIKKSGFFDLPGAGTVLDFPPAHAITVPLIGQADGTMIVDPSANYAWFPFRRKPPKHRDDKSPRGGAYPGPYLGPCVSIYIDPKGASLNLDKVDLTNLTNALAKPGTASSIEDVLDLDIGNPGILGRE
ncbi:MAG: hypothetical protein ACYCPS_06875 [Candidatus Saccharimonadales bacterium]